MRRWSLPRLIQSLALIAMLASCKTHVPPQRPSADFQASRKVTQEFGAADDPIRLQDPAYLKAWQDRQRRQFELMYPDVEQALKLSPQTHAKLLDLLIDQQLENVMLLMPAPDGSIDGAAITRQSNALMFKQEDQLAKFFGPDLKPAWDRYREANSRRQGAESLARAIEANAERLRPDQVQALASILQQAQQDTFITHSKSPPARIPFDGSPEAMNAMRERAHRQVEARDARILQLAKPILSRRQLASLDQVLSSHRFWAAKARAN